jgi:hypothetical protein
MSQKTSLIGEAQTIATRLQLGHLGLFLLHLCWWVIVEDVLVVTISLNKVLYLIPNDASGLDEVG